MCRDLTLYDHIGLGDGGETSVQRVDLSRGKKSLKKKRDQSSKTCATGDKIYTQFLGVSKR